MTYTENSTDLSVELDVAGASWRDMNGAAASFEYTCDYKPDDNGTLIVGDESASLSISWHGEAPATERLYPTDHVRVKYRGSLLFVGKVDSTSISRAAANNTDGYDTTQSVTLLGRYAISLSTMVTIPDLPKQSPIDRLTAAGITVTNWSARD